MTRKKLTRIIALCMACLGMGVFAFSGCKNNNGTSDGSGGGKHEISSGGKDEDKKEEDDGNGSGSDEKEEDDDGNGSGSDEKEEDDDGNGSGSDEKEEDEEGSKAPVISGPVQGGVKITKASENELEAAYVQWTAAKNAEWYNVYYSVADENDWTKLDAPLVREYKNYFRADIPGLKAGEYDMKVVPVSGEDEEATDYEATASGIPVKAHTREGYAFVNGTSSGAYNEDGTLKSDAKVIYVTDANKDTLELDGVTGIQNILQAQKKATAPLSVRFIGNISAPAIPDKSFNKYENSLQIKENGKGITLEGIGNDATANGWTLRLVSVSNIEVRNIGFMNTACREPDDVGIEKGDHVWVHNCDLFYGGSGSDNDQAKGDGALDTKLATYVTHSYNHFYDTGKSNLQGMKDEDVTNYVTYHHNWYDHSDSRHPRIRTCTTHIYNNYYDGTAKYGVGVTSGASAFVENNYFRSTVTMKPMLVSGQGTDARGEGTFSGESGGVIKAYGNYFDGKYSLITQNDTSDKTDIDCYLASSRDETVPAEYKAKEGKKNSEGAGASYTNFDTASDFYKYTPDTAEQAKVNVERYAGRMDGGDFKWEFDDKTQDGNYSVIPELKAALAAYKSDLVKIDNVAVTGGSTTGGTTGGESGENGGEGEDDTENPPAGIEGAVTFIPKSDTNSSFTVAGSAKSHSEITVGGVAIPKNGALKMDSSGKVDFTTTAEMTLTLYLGNTKSVKIDGTEYTPSGSENVVTLTISAGSHSIGKGNGENYLYLIVLTPKE